LFFSAAYTESLFLLTALAAWFHFRRGEHLAAAGWGLLAGLTRPNGCFLSIPLGLLALGMRDAPGNGTTEGGLWRRLIVAAMPGIGMLIFTAYLYQMTGIWFAWSKTHAAWGRVLGGETPLAGLTGLGSDGLLGFASDHPYDLLNGLGLLLALLPVRAVWRLSPAWTMFVLVNVLVPLAAGGLLSMGRLTSTLFPVFLACGMSMSPRLATAATVGFAVVQGLLAACSTRRGVFRVAPLPSAPAPATGIGHNRKYWLLPRFKVAASRVEAEAEVEAGHRWWNDWKLEAGSWSWKLL
jgi:hypothetical protein